MNFNVLITGVGGQGNLFASNVLASYFMNNGYNVLAVDTIGAAQRGGSVVSHLRTGDSEIYSPLIPAGKVDILVGFETLEMLRNFQMLAADGIYLLNDFKEPTVLCNLELDIYPSDKKIKEALKKSGKKGYIIKATEYARQIGGSFMTNVIMLGALCQLSPLLNSEKIKQIVADKAPPKTRQLNLKAFDAGGSLILETICQS
jgi:indolepyruvate ferredoxin oxidoreductase beta subunit